MLPGEDCNRASVPPDNNCPGGQQPLLDGLRPLAEPTQIPVLTPAPQPSNTPNFDTSRPLLDGQKRGLVKQIPTHGRSSRQTTVIPDIIPPGIGLQPSISPAIASDVGQAADAIPATQTSFDIADLSGSGSVGALSGATLELPDASNILVIPQAGALDAADAAQAAADSADYASTGAQSAGATLSAAGSVIPIIGEVIGLIVGIIEFAKNPRSYDPSNFSSNFWNVSIGRTRIGLQNIVDLFQGVPRLAKSQAVARALGGVSNRALSNYLQTVQAALNSGVPLSVSSGPWRARLDHASAQAIKGLEGEGYPPDLATQLFTQLIQGHIHQIPDNYGQWLLKHPNYKAKLHAESHRQHPKPTPPNPRPGSTARSVHHSTRKHG